MAHLGGDSRVAELQPYLKIPTAGISRVGGPTRSSTLSREKHTFYNEDPSINRKGTEMNIAWKIAAFVVLAVLATIGVTLWQDKRA